MEDSFKHKGMRRKLVEALREKGIDDERVLEAIGKVPRHLFLDSSFLEFAYQDKAFPIGSGQTISQPYTVAYQTSLLNIRNEEKVLEIGTGSGYQSCVLVELGAKVFSIERQRNLFDRTKALLPSIGYKPRLFYGDGYLGLPAFAPFDKILITAATEDIPQALINQLKTGGILVAPVGPREFQTMVSIRKLPQDKLEKVEHEQFRFVPMLEKRAKD